MRYTDPRLVIPYFNEDGHRTHTSFNFKGVVDKRRLRRFIRSFLRGKGIHAPKYYVDHYIQHWLKVRRG